MVAVFVRLNRAAVGVKKCGNNENALQSRYQVAKLNPFSTTLFSLFEIRLRFPKNLEETLSTDLHR